MFLFFPRRLGVYLLLDLFFILLTLLPHLPTRFLFLCPPHPMHEVQSPRLLLASSWKKEPGLTYKRNTRSSALFSGRVTCLVAGFWSFIGRVGSVISIVVFMVYVGLIYYFLSCYDNQYFSILRNIIFCFMSRNTIVGRFCVVIMVLIDKRVVSILRHSFFRVTEHVVGRLCVFI